MREVRLATRCRVIGRAHGFGILLRPREIHAAQRKRDEMEIARSGSRRQRHREHDTIFDACPLTETGERAAIRQEHAVQLCR
jgi:hypothetical protein